MRYKASRKNRVTSRNDIDRVFSQGRRANDGLFTLLACPNDMDYSRAGVAVSTNLGNAVRRNRIKRLCREAFRLCRPDLSAGWDFMLIPRKGADFTLDGLKGSLLTLAGKITGGKTPPKKDTL